MADLDAFEEGLAAGELAAVETACLKACAEEPANAALWDVRGRVALARKDLVAAEAHLARAIEIDPAPPLRHFHLARVHHQRGSLSKAGRHAWKALKQGLAGKPVALAQVWSAYFALAQGHRTNAVAQLSACAKLFNDELAADLQDEAIGRDALRCAVCANDMTLACRIFASLAPGNVRATQLAAAPTSTMISWAQRHGAPATTIEQARDVAIPSSSPYSQAYAYTTEPAVMVSMAGGRWVPGWDFAIAPDGTVLADSGYMPLTVPKQVTPHFAFPEAERVIHIAPERQEFVDADVLFLSAPTEPNFGHWMIDFLPRLRALDFLTLKDIKIAVPENLGRKHMETLALWGLSESNLVQGRRDTSYTFRTLHVFRPGQALPPNPTHVDYVRRHLFSPMTRPTGPKRIFLDRTSVGTRMIANRVEFDALLKREDFTTLEMAELSIDQQRAALGNAEVLLGAYGTNLLALYHAPPGCTVIAMMENPDWDPTVAPTASLLGLHHQFLHCAPPPEAKRQKIVKNIDIVVDCDELTRRLREI